MGRSHLQSSPILGNFSLEKGYRRLLVLHLYEDCIIQYDMIILVRSSCLVLRFLSCSRFARNLSKNALKMTADKPNEYLYRPAVFIILYLKYSTVIILFQP